MAALCVLLAAACLYDYRKKKIPNPLSAAAFFLGVGWRCRAEGAAGLLFFLGQAAMVMVPLYLLYRIGVVGAGDVKLFGITAGFLPFKKVKIFLFVSLLIAAILSLLKLLSQNNLEKRLRHLAGYVSRTVQKGWELYPESGLELAEAGIRLSGPILASLLLYLGGVY